MGEGARGRWLDSDGRWQPGPPPDGWWQERGGGERWYPPALANHPAARRPPGMPRPWARDGDRDRERDGADDRDGRDGRADRLDRPDRHAAGDRADGSDPPSAEGTGEAIDDALDLVDELLDDPAAFPTLDPPWPDGDLPDRRWPDVGGALREPLPESDGVHIVWPSLDEGGDGEDGDDALPLLRLGPSWNEPAPCRVPRRQLRPVHRRRSRHSFEPADLSDTELDQLLRGPSLSIGSDNGAAAGAGGWPVWAKIAVVLVVVLAGLGVLGVLEATAGGSADTITTREPRRGPNRTADDPAPVAPSPRPPSVPAPVAPPSTTPAGPAPAPPDSSDREVVPPEDAAPATAASDGSPAAVPPASQASQSAPASPAAPPANPRASPPRCHPSYDPCVPVADDVDCAGGQGNGPAFVVGPVGVVGPDPYGLDADHDGLGCE